MDHWEYDILGIYNYKKHGKLDQYFRFLRENQHIPGDLAEAGVFNGRTLLATALFLKEIGSDKNVVGFDTFNGLPDKTYNDEMARFDEMAEDGRIEKSHHDAIQKLIKYRKGQPLSLSGSFVRANANAIQNKAALLGLNNITLVKGEFKKTMKGEYTFMAALLDCDLYESYRTALRSSGQDYPKVVMCGWMSIIL